MEYVIDLSETEEDIIPKFRPLLFDRHKIIILRGGRGSGKTKFAVQKIIYRIMNSLELPDVKHNIIALRKTSNNCDRTIVKEFQQVIEWWGLSDLVTYNKTAKLFEFIDGSSILCTGLDDPQRIKGIHEPTSLFLDEATEFTKDDYIQAVASMRGKKPTYYQTILSFNPISIKNWIYKEFFMRPKESVLYHHSTFQDNIYLDADYEKTLNSLVGENINYRRILIEGEWGSLEGLIYPPEQWEEIENEEAKKYDGEWVYGVDFGFNHPTTCIGVKRINETTFLVDEVLCESNLTVNDMIERFNYLLEDKNAYMYCDGSRPENTDELFRAGFNSYAANRGPESVKTSIDFVKRFKLLVTSRSTNLINELQTYSWKQNKEKEFLDEPLKANDDCMDGMRYAIYSHWFNPAMEIKLYTGE